MCNKKAKIIKVKDLLSKENLDIPEYQRPYKWTFKNINKLIDDILRFKNKDAYRLGTVVVHNEIEKDTYKLNIVDGQQRITTLILLLKVILNNQKLINAFFKEYAKNLHNEIILPELNFSNPLSLKNIQLNYQELKKKVNDKEFDENVVYFLLNKCEIVYIELDDITEAFQFFDSQNARGKDLAPHDLLKAYHLREMYNISEEEKTHLIKVWEKTDEEGNLEELFNNYLFKISNWSRGKSARYFTKNDVDTFKGISISENTKELYPYALLYQMTNVFVDDYNQHSSRRVDLSNLQYPFQLDLPILNGKRFFEMISFYSERVKKIRNLKDNKTIKFLDDYNGKNRIGDTYVRLLFECALIYYIDKFGEKEIDKVIDKFFIWAYKLRLELQAVRLASVDNKAIESNVFKIIKDANIHTDVVNLYVANIDNIKFKHNELKNKFKELGYYDGE